MFLAARLILLVWPLVQPTRGFYRSLDISMNYSEGTRHVNSSASSRMEGDRKGGTCWSVVGENGRCTEILSVGLTKEECCSAKSSPPTAAFGPDTLDPGTLFFWRVLGGGVPCVPCRESCVGVDCGEGKKCVVRSGRPKCICAPNCREKGRNGVRGPVCGTDGRSYKTLCRLKKRACRKRNPSLVLAYPGTCQNSCEKVGCPYGKYCILDQNLQAHCVQCSRRCGDDEGEVCGVDGITYPSACHLREAACLNGRAIPIAYKGHCLQAATCRSIQCKERERCLTDDVTGAPRCVNCNYRCRNSKGSRELGGPICANNNRTYPSWCHMLKDACATGFAIESKFSGPCHFQPGKGPIPIGNNVLEEANLLS